jgi:hypothetical protein
LGDGDDEQITVSSEAGEEDAEKKNYPRLPLDRLSELLLSSESLDYSGLNLETPANQVRQLALLGAVFRGSIYTGLQQEINLALEQQQSLSIRNEILGSVQAIFAEQLESSSSTTSYEIPSVSFANIAETIIPDNNLTESVRQRLTDKIDQILELDNQQLSIEQRIILIGKLLEFDPEQRISRFEAELTKDNNGSKIVGVSANLLEQTYSNLRSLHQQMVLNKIVEGLDTENPQMMIVTEASNFDMYNLLASADLSRTFASNLDLRMGVQNLSESNILAYQVSIEQPQEIIELFSEDESEPEFLVRQSPSVIRVIPITQLTIERVESVTGEDILQSNDPIATIIEKHSEVSNNLASLNQHIQDLHDHRNGTIRILKAGLQGYGVELRTLTDTLLEKFPMISKEATEDIILGAMAQSLLSQPIEDDSDDPDQGLLSLYRQYLENELPDLDTGFQEMLNNYYLNYALEAMHIVDEVPHNWYLINGSDSQLRVPSGAKPILSNRLADSLRRHQSDELDVMIKKITESKDVRTHPDFQDLRDYLINLVINTVDSTQVNDVVSV